MVVLLHVKYSNSLPEELKKKIWSFHTTETKETKKRKEIKWVNISNKPCGLSDVFAFCGKVFVEPS